MFKAVLRDQSAKTPGLVIFQVKGKWGSHGVSPAVRADIVVPDTGQCFEATWPQTLPARARCLLSGTKLSCK